MTGAGKLKTYCHIWDNVMSSTSAARHQEERHHRKTEAAAYQDSTGSSVTILEYSEDEIAVVEESLKKCQPPVRKYPVIYPPIVQKPKKQTKPNFCTNRDRELAEQPKALNTWKYQKERKEKYDCSSVSKAFDEYTHRLGAKKMRLEQERKLCEQQKANKRVTVKKCKTETGKEDRKVTPNAPREVEFLNRRDDDIVIDSFNVKKVVAHADSDQTPSGPGFYGTIEAEVSAEHAAHALATAGEHLERLQFVAGAVYPDVGNHLKMVEEIAGDIKDFGVQQRANCVKPPTSVTCSQVAHFVIAENSAD